MDSLDNCEEHSPIESNELFLIHSHLCRIVDGKSFRIQTRKKKTNSFFLARPWESIDAEHNGKYNNQNGIMIDMK